jgi:hypothetical protein
MTKKPIEVSIKVDIDPEFVESLLKDQIKEALGKADIESVIAQAVRQKTAEIERSISPEDLLVDVLQVRCASNWYWNENTKNGLESIDYLKHIAQRLWLDVEEKAIPARNEGSADYNEDYSHDYRVQIMFPGRIKRKELCERIGAIGKYYPLYKKTGLSCLFLFHQEISSNGYGALKEIAENGKTIIVDVNEHDTETSPKKIVINTIWPWKKK